MSKRLLPLFPLQLVVFPRTQLPLHIFEERYKEMVGEAIRDQSEFGIVLAKDGGILNAGCSVKVVKVLEAYPDGRLDILTLGQRRFEIVSLDEDRAFLQGEVEFFDDEDIEPVPESVREQALVNYQALKHMESARGHGEPDLGDRQLSFQVAQAVPDLDFLTAILRGRSETVRLRQFNDYLAQYLPRQRAIDHMKAVAPRNGHGMKPPGI